MQQNGVIYRVKCLLQVKQNTYSVFFIVVSFHIVVHKLSHTMDSRVMFSKPILTFIEYLMKLEISA